MLHIKLHDRRQINPDDDPMRRTWVGYDPNVTAEDLFEQNRGRWVLGARADREKYALFSYTVKFVAAIEGFESSAGKRMIVGRVLSADEPVAQRWVGADAPDRFRNPATYFRESGGSASECACGCGEAVPASRSFVPGHDQKAIHARIARQWGGTVEFIDWFDATYPDAA